MVRSYHSILRKSRKKSRNVKSRKKSKSRSRSRKKSMSIKSTLKKKRSRSKKNRRMKGGLSFELNPASIDGPYTLGVDGHVAPGVNFNAGNELALNSGEVFGDNTTDVPPPEQANVSHNQDLNTNNIIDETPYSLKGDGGNQVKDTPAADIDIE